MIAYFGDSSTVADSGTTALDPELVADVGDIFTTQQRVAKQQAALKVNWKYAAFAAVGLAGLAIYLGGRR